MTTLAEFGRDVGSIADEAGHSWDAMSEQQLSEIAGAMGMELVQCSALLLSRCGDDVERTRMQIARAMDLPAKVLQRRAKEAEAIIARDGELNVPQHAAWIAVIVRNMHNISARIERRRAGAALN